MPWPFQPVHRFFPHFNHLSDDEARAEVRRVARGLRGEIIGESIVAGLLVGLFAAGVFSCLVSAMFFLNAPGFWGYGATRWFFVTSVGMTSAFCGYLAAVRHYTSMLRRVLTHRLPPPPKSAARCSHCSYPLMQLPERTGGMVQCPECGAWWNERRA